MIPGQNFTVQGHQDFDQLANQLLNNYILKINETEWRIAEIEFYYYSSEHPDNYTHKDADQQRSNEWYFHRQNGGSFKGGTYKGLDISIGNGVNYGGILIRSIRLESPRNQDTELIEGPCNVVNKILSLTHCETINDLVTKIKPNVFEPGLLYLSPMKLEELYIMKGPRVGLTLKKNTSFDFLTRRYRYVTSDKIKKNKCTLTLSEYTAEKRIIDQKNLQKWVKFYENGKDKTEDYFIKENPAINTVTVQCELLGYVEARNQSKKDELDALFRSVYDKKPEFIVVSGSNDSSVNPFDFVGV